MIDFSRKKCFVFDMDGTIYLENSLIEGTIDLINYFKDNNVNYYFLTNNSSKNVISYMDKLDKMNIHIDKDKIISSTFSTILYLKEHFDTSIQNFYVIGTNDMIDELIENNIKVVNRIEGVHENVNVIVGFDNTLEYEKLRVATYYLKRNPLIIATNCDMVCPLSGGEITPDCGAIVALLKSVVNCRVVFCGKPNIEILQPIFNQGFSKKDMVIVGDRLYTDIALGVNNSIDTIAVETGEFKSKDLSNSNIQPSLVLNSVKDLVDILRGI